MSDETMIKDSPPTTAANPVAVNPVVDGLESAVRHAEEYGSTRLLRGYLRRRWLRFGVSGLALWAVAVGVTLLTNDTILLPTVVMLGSFVVPLTWLMRRIELDVARDDAPDLPLPLILRTFVYGGVTGVLSSALLETWLLRFSGQAFYIGVALIEEAVKLVVLWWLTRRLRGHSMIDGMILGATVGFGFAAFESSGYALNALYSSSGESLGALVSVEAVRGLIAPVSHGLWTAIAGAVFFRERANGRFRITGALVAAYALVSSLHALWDLAPALARGFTLLAVGKGWQLDFFGALVPGGQLTHAEVDLQNVIDVGIQIGVAASGLLVLHRCRIQARTASHTTPGGVR
jgi:RsiW-degrading membrane proteinase PrsW (M82 family)